MPRTFDYPARHIIRVTDKEMRVNVPSALFKLGGDPLWANPSVLDPIFRSQLLFVASPVLSNQTTGQALTTIHYLALYLRGQPLAGPGISRLLEFCPEYSAKHMSIADAPGAGVQMLAAPG